MYRSNNQLKTNAFRYFQLVLSLQKSIKEKDFCNFFMYSFSASNTTEHNSCFTYEVSFHHNQDVDLDVCVFERR